MPGEEIILNKKIIKKLFQKHLVLDGAMGTELEKYGVQTDNNLWSAMALVKNPKAVINVHKSYLSAGANIIITDSYQANLKAFEREGLTRKQSQDLIRRSVYLAKIARAQFYREAYTKKPLLIAGSIGPYGAYLANGDEYSDNYHLTQKEYQDFHYSRMKILANAGVDLFAFETQPKFEEVKALVSLLINKFPQLPAYISFSVDGKSKLCDGTSIIKAVQYFSNVPQIIALGVNCTAIKNIEGLVELIKPDTSRPIIVYPNNGDIYDPVTKDWKESTQDLDLAELSKKWKRRGANIIGGCCRTTPKDIKNISKMYPN